MPSVVKGDEAVDNSPAPQTTNSHPVENSDVTKKCPFMAAKAKEEKTAEKNNKADGQGNETTADVPPSGTITVHFIIPGVNEPVETTFSLQDSVQDLRQVVLDRPESCYRTSFSLQVNGVRLDDFAELHMIDCLKDGVNIKVVEEPYSVREARIHLRRLKDLLSTNILSNSYSAIDNLSLSFLSAVTGVDVEEEAVKSKGQNQQITVSTEECIPPVFVFSSEEAPPLLEPLFPSNTETKVPMCVKDLSPSGWNPPPGYRKLSGDLMYIDIVTLEDVHINVTASTSGFFINRTHDAVFNPQPHSDPCRSHSLVGLLTQLSPMFRKNFALLQKTSLKRHPLEVIPTPYQVFPWAVKKTEHTIDTLRAEDAAATRIGYEEHMPGQLRDWNEELQSARELPRETMQQRLLRDRAIFKISSDFVAASTRGAVAVVDGNVMAINPGEDEKKRMFIWNNIFFSFAFDSRDHYQEVGGDDAAHAAAGLDLRGIVAYNRADTTGLFTLGTVVVDYRGYRVIAQSIIPGILQREQESSVVYGSIDSGNNVATHDKFLELMKQSGKSLRIRPHKVLNEDNKEIELCSSVECKGIIGADGRHYILDLFRTFPPDANFLGARPVTVTSTSEDGKEQRSLFPRHFRHKLCSLRPELIESFMTFRYVLFLKLVAMHVSSSKQKQAQVEQESSENSKGSEKQKEIESENEKIDKNESKVLKSEESRKSADARYINGDAETVDEKAVEEKMTSSDSDVSHVAIKEAAKTVGSISDTDFDIRFNPDTHLNTVKRAESESSALALDKRLIQEASDFLVETVIIKMVEDFISLIQTPLDGAQLVEILHTRGINVRYLGKIATIVASRDDLTHVHKVSVLEMIVRAAKHVFRNYIQSSSLRTLSAAISHFLNCFLSAFPNPLPQLPSEEAVNKKKKSRKKPSRFVPNNAVPVVAWAALTPEHLWKTISGDMKSSFGFDLDCSSCEDVERKYKLLRVSMLRSFCLKTGVQVQLKEYDFLCQMKKHATFLEDDILNIFPVVKHVSPKATDAVAVFEAAQGRLQAGCLAEAHDLMVESLNLFHQVYGPLHADVATCYRSIAKLHYLADDAVQAVCYQRKAVIVCERVFGVDHPDTVIAYVHLALYCHNANLPSVALTLMYRARYLALLVFGEGHPDMATFDSNIGLILHGQREFKISEKFLEKALDVQLKYHGKESIHSAMSFHLLARAKACVSDFRAALQNEKSAYGIYKTKFGENDQRTKESSDYLQQCTQQAVLIQKKLNELAGKPVSREKGGAADVRVCYNVPNIAPSPNIGHLMGLISFKGDQATPTMAPGEEINTQEHESSLACD